MSIKGSWKSKNNGIAIVKEGEKKSSTKIY